MKGWKIDIFCSSSVFLEFNKTSGTRSTKPHTHNSPRTSPYDEVLHIKMILTS